MRRRQAGLTLMEVLVAITLLGLLSVGMLTALRVGASAWEVANTSLTLDRRIATANRILHAALEDAMPILAEYERPPLVNPLSFYFFQGEPKSMRFVTAYSLESGPRGGLKIIELQVVEGPKGLRVLLNEQPFGSPRSAGSLVTSVIVNPLSGETTLAFAPIVARPTSFILADELAACSFSYLIPEDEPMAGGQWVSAWRRLTRIPAAITVQLEGRKDSPRLQPVSLTVPVRSQMKPL